MTPVASWSFGHFLPSQSALPRSLVHGLNPTGLTPPPATENAVCGRARPNRTCGDCEADRFNIPAGSTFAAHIAPAGQAIDGLVLWRFIAVDADDVDGCADEIRGCED
ncbi:hypothetical protein [Streptomyces sp. NPDC014006]|uniref:hypothetical protein n=1 Tax=Streptomyces sp. NPDC014006 TaxID=3364870 RepID=UPI0036FE9B0D